MQIGMIGLGRMGASIARRLMRHGHDVVTHDRNARGHGTTSRATAPSRPQTIEA